MPLENAYACSSVTSPIILPARLMPYMGTGGSICSRPNLCAQDGVLDLTLYVFWIMDLVKCKFWLV